MNRKGNGMQVYFDTSLWLSKKGRPCKVRQDTDAVFTEGGLTRCVPTVYCFKQGIVFDILTVRKGTGYILQQYGISAFGP